MFAKPYEIRSETIELLERYDGTYAQLYQECFRKLYQVYSASKNKIGNMRMDRFTPPWLFDISQLVVVSENGEKRNIILNKLEKPKNAKFYRSKSGCRRAMVILAAFYEKECSTSSILGSLLPVNQSNPSTNHASPSSTNNIIECNEDSPSGREMETSLTDLIDLPTKPEEKKIKSAPESNSEIQQNTKFDGVEEMETNVGPATECSEFLNEEEEKMVLEELQMKCDSKTSGRVVGNVSGSEITFRSLERQLAR